MRPTRVTHECVQIIARLGRLHKARSSVRQWGRHAVGFKWENPMPAASLAPPSARTYNCAWCQTQVRVCTPCDRGQRYCCAKCRHQSRLRSQRRASACYQSSRCGRINHARRQQRYRDRRQEQIVTHQGSQDPSVSDVLTPELEVAQGPVCRGLPTWHCHWCARSVASVVRRNWLRHATTEEPVIHRMKAAPHGQSP